MCRSITRPVWPSSAPAEIEIVAPSSSDQNRGDPQRPQNPRRRPLTSTYHVSVSSAVSRSASRGAAVYAPASVPLRRQSEQLAEEIKLNAELGLAAKPE